MARKPSELREDAVDTPRTKEFIKELRKSTGGKIYVYQWSQEKSETPPLCIFVDPDDFSCVAAQLEELGATKTERDGTKMS